MFSENDRNRIRTKFVTIISRKKNTQALIFLLLSLTYFIIDSKGKY